MHPYVRWHSKRGLLCIPHFKGWGKHIQSEDKWANNTFKVRTFFYVSLNMTSTNKAREMAYTSPIPPTGRVLSSAPSHKARTGILSYVRMSSFWMWETYAFPRFECHSERTHVCGHTLVHAWHYVSHWLSPDVYAGVKISQSKWIVGIFKTF